MPKFFASMDAENETTQTYPSNVLNAKDIQNMLSKQTPEMIAQEHGEAAGQFAAGIHAFGYTIAEAQSVVMNKDGFIVKINVT